MARVNYKALLVSRAERVKDDPPRALTTLQLRQQDDLKAWRERWMQHQRFNPPNLRPPRPHVEDDDYEEARAFDFAFSPEFKP